MSASDADHRHVGIDVGTSQVRACAIADAGEQVGFATAPLPVPERVDGRVLQDPAAWWSATLQALESLFRSVPPSSVRSIAVDGTSGTLLVADAQGEPLLPALMYNDQSSVDEAMRVAAVAPPKSAAHGASAAIAKLLQLLARLDASATPHHALHQADWIAAQLSGRLGVADENNALKLGYDPLARRWPEWIVALGVDQRLLPAVVPPGTPYGPVARKVARRFGLRDDTAVVAGTTDSVAAAIACGIEHIGDAVTSLGSTLALKVVSGRPINSAAHGVYTHRLGELWLAGGASNTGGAVLARYFSTETIDRLSARIAASLPSAFDYYPLLAPGERFPINDPTLQPRLSPRPSDEVAFLHGLLESIARIERQGYRLLESLGAPYPTSVGTAGGGARNATWRRIRERVLGVPVFAAPITEAAYGTALLARRGAHPGGGKSRQGRRV
jgi:sugar (pentulose or hexulose) kinase